jgi:mRNA-degrading endonuclease toxin of MazEF toxin-antitoxin module
VTVVEISTTARGLAAEVAIDHAQVGLERQSVINCDGVHTIAQSVLTKRVGELDDGTVGQVCSALVYALGC